MTDALPPLAFRWTGEAMSPLNPHWARRADAAYVVGEIYTLVPYEERSHKSHAHYFAAVNDLWHSLPEHLSAEFPTPDHLRRRALIATGYRDQRTIVCSSKAEALRVAAFIRPMDTYAVVSVSDSVVVHLTAQTQSHKGMDRKTFQASKDAVLGYLSDLVGVERRSDHDDVASARAA